MGDGDTLQRQREDLQAEKRDQADTADTEPGHLTLLPLRHSKARTPSTLPCCNADLLHTNHAPNTALVMDLSSSFLSAFLSCRVFS